MEQKTPEESRHTAVAQGVVPRPLVQLLCCPRCAGKLLDEGILFRCSACGQAYPLTNEIPQLFVPSLPTAGKLDVTNIVKEFYEEVPFPNYDDLDNSESLRSKARRNIFADLLDRQLPPNALVLEAGCGTGQLTNFLGLHSRRRVIGADMCMNSLGLANGFRSKFAIANATFLQMNLFRPPFMDETFDVIISNGVLHTTGDPEGGFKSLTAKLKPGGFFIVGLYNWIGHLSTRWRGFMINLFGNRFAFLDKRLRGQDLNEGRWAAWFRDQYKHPHDTCHSMTEVLRWFDSAGLEFLSSIPTIDNSKIDKNWRLFEPHSAGTAIDRFSTELELLLYSGADGGLFIMIGRKRTS